MNDLLKKVNNRYMLVNLAAKRARDIAEDAELREVRLTEKPVKSALGDIINDKILLVEPESEVSWINE